MSKRRRKVTAEKHLRAERLKAFSAAEDVGHCATFDTTRREVQADGTRTTHFDLEKKR